MLPDQDAINSILRPYVQPWYDSLLDPAQAQMGVLADLLPTYAITDYGMSHNASEIKQFSDFQANFPITNYNGLAPYLAWVKEGNYKALLPEPPQAWVMTRGSTGHSKVLPATQTHLKQIYSCGARAILNYAVRKKQYDVFLGVILNLNFPSSVHTMTQDGKKLATATAAAPTPD